MKLLKRHYRLVVLAAACVALGAAVSAITSAGASTPASGTTSTASSAAVHHRNARWLGLGRAVQGNLVVHTKSGWVTVTFERGVVKSVSGNQLTITERTKNAVYKDVTLTIPSNAKVRDNRQNATLGQLKSGQHVLVISGPSRTLVSARG